MKVYEMSTEAITLEEFLFSVAPAESVVSDEMCHDAFLFAMVLECQTTVTTATYAAGYSNDGIFWISKSGTGPAVSTQVV